MAKRANPPPLTRALVQDNVPAKVADGLWIGSIHAAFNQDSMQDRGITHVLNASGLPATFPRQFTYFSVDVRDKENTNILGAIGVVNIFIEAGVENGGVLVHCAGGRSRSVAFVVAFIMSTQRCSYDYAYAQVRRARPVASINRGFEQQLRAYGATQCDVFAAHQMMLRVKAGMLYERRLQKLQREGSMSSIATGSTRSGLGVTGSGGGRGSARSVGGTVGDEQGSANAESAQQLPPPTPAARQQASHANASTSTAIGIPPTPRSPRGRGRASVGGSPASSSTWQRKGGPAGGPGGGVMTTSGAAAQGGSGSSASGGGKGRDDLHFLSKEPRPTRFRLCRPGSASIQVIPPLESLERIYACRSCGTFLFTGAHVIKLNHHLPSIQAILGRTAPGSPAHEYYSDPDAEASSCAPEPDPNESTSSPVTTTAFRGSSCCGPGPHSSAPASRCSPLAPQPAYGILSGRGHRISPTPPPPPLPPPDYLVEESKSSASNPPSSWKRPGSNSDESGALLLGSGGLSGDFKLERPPAHLGRWPGGRPEVGTGAQVAGAPSRGAENKGLEQGEFKLERPPAHLGRWPEMAPSERGIGEQGGLPATNDSKRDKAERTPLGGDDRGAPQRGGVETSGSSIGATASGGFRAQSPMAYIPPSCPLRPGGSGTGAGGGNRNRPVFGFSSEDDSSTVDPPEQVDGSKYADYAQSRRTSDAMTNASSSAGSGWGGWRHPARPKEFSGLVVQTQGSSRGRGLGSASPDRMVTPRTPGTPYGSVASASPCASESSYVSGRPVSVEKRQFLLKMQALEVSTSTTMSSTPSSTSAVTDLDAMVASEIATSRSGQLIYVDFLEWMGDITVTPTGRITCPSPGCGVELGGWSWDKGIEAVRAPTGPPVIVMEKSTVKATRNTLSNFDARNSLSRENTPRSSPTSKALSAAKTSSPEAPAIENGARRGKDAAPDGERRASEGEGGGKQAGRKSPQVLDSQLGGSRTGQYQPQREEKGEPQQERRRLQERALQPQLDIESVQLHLQQQAQMQQQIQQQRQASRGSLPSPIREESKPDGLSPHRKRPPTPQQERQYRLKRGPPPPYPGI